MCLYVPPKHGTWRKEGNESYGGRQSKRQLKERVTKMKRKAKTLERARCRYLEGEEEEEEEEGCSLEFLCAPFGHVVFPRSLGLGDGCSRLSSCVCEVLSDK